MNLDSNLLKEFAKITNDSEVKSENKYLRGTIVSNSGGKYVQIDGSTTVTPISELVDVKEGDRVLVSIENHKATIVGNYSFPPSARKEQEALDKANEAKETADGVSGVANTAQQKAQEASNKADEAINQSSIASSSANEAKQQATEAINKANDAQGNIQEAKNLSTQASADATEAKNQAAASQASSAEAQAKVTELQNEVKGAKEDINKALEDLEAQGEEITVFKETYSTKVETDKVKADLSTEIDVKVGSLQTTIEENYSTKTENVALEGRLQTQITQNAEGFASQASKIEKLEGDTAEAQKDVENALAQAAAAQSSAADAQSKANAAQAAANTATADAQEAANKAQLAQNAADAATAAANAADQAVQDAQGDLNEAKQNLANVTSRVDATEADIAEAQAKVDAAQQEVNEALADAAEARQAANNAQTAADKAQQDAETAQGVANTAKQKADNAKTAADNAQAAADKAQADVAALTSRVTSAETKILQNSEAISLNASKTEEVGEKVDNLQVGARNLMFGSKLDKKSDNANWIFYSLNSVSHQGYSTTESAYLVQTPDSGHHDNNGIGFMLNKWDSTNSKFTRKIVEPGEIYTFSIDIKGKIDNTSNNAGKLGYMYNTEVDKVIYQNIIRKTDIRTTLLEDKYTRYSVTFTVPTTAIYDFNVQMFLGYNANIYIRNTKLEKGNKATDWSPAPEDIESDVDGVKTNLANNYYTKTQTDAQIKVQSDRITSTVSKVETVEKTANAAQDSINNLQVGGRNYLRETRNFKLDNNRVNGWQNTHFSFSTENNFNIGTASATGLTGNSIKSIYSSYVDFNLIKGKPVCISFDIKVEDVTAWDQKVPFIWELFDSNNGRIGYRDMALSYDNYNIHTLESNIWTRLVCIIPKDFNITYSSGKTINDVMKAGLRLTLFRNGKVSYRKVKLEVGNMATDWTPAPEDAESSITNAQNTANTAKNTADAAKADIDGLVVSGRNLVPGSSGEWSDWWTPGTGTNKTKVFGTVDLTEYALTTNDKVVFQIVYEVQNMTSGAFWGQGPVNGIWTGDGYFGNPWNKVIQKVSADWNGVAEKSYVWKVSSDCASAESRKIQMGMRVDNANAEAQIRWKCLKVEIGTIPTDWSPAPEDLSDGINNAQSTADNAKSIADGATSSVVSAHSRIEQLADIIANLVTDENGTSLMTQTTDGWRFDMSSINSNLATLDEKMGDVEDGQKDTNDALEKLKGLLESVEAKTAYITIGKDDNGNPCIELGKNGNDFKVRITNTAIDFLEGSTKIAYVNNNTFYTEKMIVKNELQIGNGPGFVWRTRANGNMGLVYISG